MSRDRVVEYNGEQITVSDLARRHGIHPVTFKTRIDRKKLSIEEALTRPVKGNWKKRNMAKLQTTAPEIQPMPSAHIGPDPKIARKIYSCLDEYFDDKKRVYIAGWSDQRVAKELDVSLDLVTRIRAEAYGELAEDPAVQSVKDDIALLRMELDEFYAARKAEIERIEARLQVFSVTKKQVG